VRAHARDRDSFSGFLRLGLAPGTTAAVKGLFA
jgi:hypothetical protein